MKFGQVVAAMATALVLSNSVVGEQLPLYEWGVGPGGLSLPHYLGAEQNHSLVAPVPYFIYRGEHLRFDRSGLSAYLVDDERLELNVSVNASLPVDSDDNRARRGMQDLELLLEAGPTLRYTPWRSRDSRSKLRLDLPLRGAFSAEGLKLDYQGLTSSPTVAFFSRFREWHWTASYSAIFSDRDYHSYFYDVEAEYVTPQRHYHRSDAGYTASRFSLSVARHYPSWFVGAYVRYYSQHGAANRDSPLLKRDENLSAGFIVAWLFGKSETLVNQELDPGL